MALTLQTINIGAAPGDRTGDVPRVSGTKINENFALIQATFGSTEDALASATAAADAAALALTRASEATIAADAASASAVAAAAAANSAIVYNVLLFGAIGDGVSDDTVAINAAATAAGDGGTVYIPAGIYKLSPSLVDAAIVLPEGVSLDMSPGAWLTTTETAMTFVAPLGRNRITVNIDGNGYPASGGVAGTWTRENVGIRAYYSAPIGLGADDVTVIGGEIKNCSYGIRPDGAVNWRVSETYIHRIKNSGMLWGFYSGYDCTGNMVECNRIEECGDYAVAFFQVGGESAGDADNNIVRLNRAKNCQYRVNGYAFGCEQGTASRQKRFQFIENTYTHDAGTGSTSAGGVTIATTTDSVARGNRLEMITSRSSADGGVNARLAVNATIERNYISGFRQYGVSTDGAIGVVVDDNTIRNCGGTSSGFPAIIVALSDSTTRITVTNNEIELDDAYAYYGAGTPAIIAIAAATKTLSEITISDNRIRNPNDLGIQVAGYSGGLASAITVTGNEMRAPAGSTFFQRSPLSFRYCENVNVSRNLSHNAKRGIEVKNCTNGVVDSNVFTGANTLSTAFLDVTSSTGIELTDNKSKATITTAISGSMTSNKFRRNDPGLTENGGTSASIASGGTITHGLAATPTVVNVTPGAYGVTGNIRVTAGSSTITVLFDGGVTIPWFWEAKVR